ncbi:hypothetical protein VKT23_000258 [Stygiomarasmius scandens]|uniref:Uncharacterized protein n=1 Tax=Marasmiellus scandens TaxID=2682957 RepID=A0ABR1K3K3_9AGAR
MNGNVDSRFGFFFSVKSSDQQLKVSHKIDVVDCTPDGTSTTDLSFPNPDQCIPYDLPPDSSGSESISTDSESSTDESTVTMPNTSPLPSLSTAIPESTTQIFINSIPISTTQTILQQSVSISTVTAIGTGIATTIIASQDSSSKWMNGHYIESTWAAPSPMTTNTSTDAEKKRRIIIGSVLGGLGSLVLISILVVLLMRKIRSRAQWMKIDPFVMPDDRDTSKPKPNKKGMFFQNGTDCKFEPLKRDSVSMSPNMEDFESNSDTRAQDMQMNSSLTSYNQLSAQDGSRFGNSELGSNEEDGTEEVEIVPITRAKLLNPVSEESTLHGHQIFNTGYVDSLTWFVYDLSPDLFPNADFGSYITSRPLSLDNQRIGALALVIPSRHDDPISTLELLDTEDSNVVCAGSTFLIDWQGGIVTVDQIEATTPERSHGTVISSVVHQAQTQTSLCINVPWRKPLPMVTNENTHSRFRSLFSVKSSDRRSEASHQIEVVECIPPDGDTSTSSSNMTQCIPPNPPSSIPTQSKSSTAESSMFTTSDTVLSSSSSTSIPEFTTRSRHQKPKKSVSVTTVTTVSVSTSVTTVTVLQDSSSQWMSTGRYVEPTRPAPSITPTNTNVNAKQEKRGIIIGSVLCGLVALVLITLLIIFLIREKRKRAQWRKIDPFVIPGDQEPKFSKLEKFFRGFGLGRNRTGKLDHTILIPRFEPQLPDTTSRSQGQKQRRLTKGPTSDEYFRLNNGSRRLGNRGEGDGADDAELFSNARRKPLVVRGPRTMSRHGRVETETRTRADDLLNDLETLIEKRQVDGNRDEMNDLEPEVQASRHGQDCWQAVQRRWKERIQTLTAVSSTESPPPAYRDEASTQ